MAQPLDPDSRPAIDAATVRPNFMIVGGGGSGAGPSTVHHTAPRTAEPIQDAVEPDAVD